MSIKLILALEIVRYTIALWCFAIAVGCLLWYLEQCFAVWQGEEKVVKGALIL